MLPKHIGIILDGNRRFAKELMKRPWQGHKQGLKTARLALVWSCKKGIKHMTAYALSIENLNRPKRELRLIFRYLGGECNDIIKDRTHPVHKFSVRVNFIGRTDLLPEELRKKMKRVEEITKDYKKHYLNIAVAYGGRQEISSAIRSMLKDAKSGKIKASLINEKMIRRYLWTEGQPDPDMILRTGGEKRLSNFLPFQSVYSELIFVDKRWPEMKEEDFNAALHDFQKRKRKFGR